MVCRARLCVLRRSTKMSVYILSLGDSLKSVLASVVSCQHSQFAGYCANIEFWFSEAEHLHEISSTYEDRLERMKKGVKSYKRLGFSEGNFDDCNEPYQSVGRTSKKGDRKRICAEVSEGLQKFIERAYGLELIDEQRFFELEDRLSHLK